MTVYFFILFIDMFMFIYCIWEHIVTHITFNRIDNVFTMDVFCSIFDKIIRVWLFLCFPHSYFIAIASFSQSTVIRAYSAWNQYVHASANKFPVKWNMAHYTFHFYCTDKDNAQPSVVFWNIHFVLNLNIFTIIQKWMKIKRLSRSFLFFFLSRIKNNLFWYRTLYYHNNFTNNNTSYLDHA